jgi:putative methyltransferase (TIGR04325 family)
MNYNSVNSVKTEYILTILKKILPGFIKSFAAGVFYGWHGNYSSWSEARKKCTGYDSKLILEKVRDSLLQVKNGNAIYERDSVLFNEIQFSYPVLSGLMWISAQNKGKLTVLDFGGSLGSSYYQNKRFLDSLDDVHWCVVEQPGFVKIGLEDFATDRLHFFSSVEECMKSFNINVVLLSSVLQYLEEPYILLDKLKLLQIKNIIIDRTPFVSGKDRITIQKVWPRIYKASYPCWFFNENRIVNSLITDYKLVLEFDALDKANITSKFKGFIFSKI